MMLIVSPVSARGLLRIPVMLAWRRALALPLRRWILLRPIVALLIPVALRCTPLAALIALLRVRSELPRSSLIASHKNML